jgi:magnesium transporter
MRTPSYFGFLKTLYQTERTKEILDVNPTLIPQREEAGQVVVSIFEFDADHLEEWQTNEVSDCSKIQHKGRTTWINIDGIRKNDIDWLSHRYGLHYLLEEDILSVGQRPKMDEVDDIMICVLNMLYFNDAKRSIESEQVSILLGKDFVISIQEDARQDEFDPLRQRLRNPKSQIRHRTPDFLLYAMLDLIVDNYFLVMEKLGEGVELAEEHVIRKSDTRSLATLTQLRKEQIVLKRNLAPVRDLVASIIRSDSGLLEDNNTKYFNDIYDHISQAHELSENYRDVIMGLQDLYINKVNLKMNEVMKVMAVVTCVLAPANIIGGIFGMNFDLIPLLHHPLGFPIAVAAMFAFPLLMVWIFRRRGWF